MICSRCCPTIALLTGLVVAIGGLASPAALAMPTSTRTAESGIVNSPNGAHGSLDSASPPKSCINRNPGEAPILVPCPAGPQNPFSSVALPLIAGNTLPAGTYELVPEPNFDDAKCLATLTALGVTSAVSLMVVPAEITVPAAVEIGSTLADNCAGTVVAIMVDNN